MNDFTTGEFILKRTDESKPIYLIPVGDVHRDNDMCAEDKWIDYLDWMKDKANLYVLGMGDYLDFMSTKERNKVKSANLHDSTLQQLDKMMLAWVMTLYHELSFLKGRIIGLIEGNHYGEFTNGMTTTQKLCELLECPYLGTSTYTRLIIEFTKRHRVPVDVFAHHGKGASRMMGGSLNTVEHMAAYSDADIFLQGHDHKKSVAFINKLALNSGFGHIKLVSRKILIARTGGFLKGYEQNTPSYVARAALPPTDLGLVKIEINPRFFHGRRSVDIHCSI